VRLRKSKLTGSEHNPMTNYDTSSVETSSSFNTSVVIPDKTGTVFWKHTVSVRHNTGAFAITYNRRNWNLQN
jgi:hypothetical protein